MSTTVMSLKTDKHLKEEAQKTAHELGFSLGTLINAFLRQLIKEKAVYFSTEPTYAMSKTLEKHLAKVEKDIKSGKNISPGFTDMKKAIKYLKNG